MAVSRASAAERRKAITGTIIAYAVIVLIFALLRGFWWPAIPIMAVFAGLTIWVVQHGALAAGNDWLKLSGGRWVETGRLTNVRLRTSTTATLLELEDAGGRRLDVRLDELARTPRLWEAFYAGLSCSLKNGLSLDEQTGARIRATHALVRARA